MRDEQDRTRKKNGAAHRRIAAEICATARELCPDEEMSKVAAYVYLRSEATRTAEIPGNYDRNAGYLSPTLNKPERLEKGTRSH